MYKFKSWLKEETTFTDNVIRDTCSRLNRVKKLIGDVDNDELSLLIERLEKNSEYQDINIKVKSQLKRSLTLFIQFKHHGK
ncbi:hypothetical protein GLP10_17830 [Photobacterium iliopiscarium]|uniref:hypothetical protein n=1 Tax=Photobacterium iliopiscarium TaxID=56192 RepID=UPI001E474095|nr:hypothetical protein [Photobacterium iliopiscarium]MCD9468839.1 hypothetical protein [Photobacterium iliopiscarium]MCD9488952.1 hypothetical protein [Photobacterium iliopiscarium]